jgi:CubicO group peptidase (beta-lactamase class C family)
MTNIAFALLALLAPQATDITDVLKPVRERHDLPGPAAVVLRGDEIVASGAIGVRAKGTDIAIRITDRFHIGSCTKSMTATMIATLVMDKKLAWSTTVGDSFADISDMHDEWRAVTILHLLKNRGGAPAALDADGLWKRLWSHTGAPREARRLLVEGVTRSQPAASPGATFIYSNGGLAIAGAMAEKVTDTSWEELMRGRLFEPLDMKSAGFGAPGRRGALDEPLGHTANGKPVEVGPGSDNPPAIGPAGTVHVSLPDWAKYISVHLRRRGLGLDAAAFEVLHKAGGPGERQYAAGWLLTERDWGGGRVLWHNGSNTMWYAVTWLAPERGFAVLVATNQGGPKAQEACDEAASSLIQDHVKRYK